MTERHVRAIVPDPQRLIRPQRPGRSLPFAGDDNTDFEAWRNACHACMHYDPRLHCTGWGVVEYRDGLQQGFPIIPGGCSKWSARHGDTLMPADLVPGLTAMSEARAFEINELLVAAWMIQNSYSDSKELPDLSGISLNEAVEASRIVAAAPPKPNAQGGHTHTCHVAESRIPQLYAWAISAKLRPLKSPKPDDERSFLLYYHDKDLRPKIFRGSGAREAAVHHFNSRRTAWTVTLFEEIADG